jgi:predicted RNA-binding Zn-ribbon protein involved in translation (DUF1610 family)
MPYRYNHPPNWPPHPDGWTPTEGWQPDSAWGPPPDGWVFWVEQEMKAGSQADEAALQPGSASPAVNASSSAIVGRDGTRSWVLPDDVPRFVCPSCKAGFGTSPETSFCNCPRCAEGLVFVECPSCHTKLPILTKWARWRCLRCGSSRKYRHEDTRASAGPLDVRSGPNGRGLLAPMHRRLNKSFLANLRADEDIDFAIWASSVGGVTQALLATPTRALIGKVGPVAGATLGALVTSFRYTDISSIEVRQGPINGWIEILTPAYQGALQPHFWSDNELNDPFKRPNCLPAPRRSLSKMMPYVDQLRERSVGRMDSSSLPAAPTRGHDLAAQLAQLAALREAGALSDAEFASAKQRLLG